MLKRTSMVIFALISAFACSSDQSTPTPTPTEPKVETKKFTLAIDFGDGVSGNPGKGSYQYTSGQIIKYEFSAKPGYNNTVTEEGSSVITNSGSILMDKNHNLSVHSEMVKIFPTESKQIKDDVVKFITSKDSTKILGDYLNHIQTVEKIYNSYDMDRAREIVQSGYLGAYLEANNENADKFEEILGGKLFNSKIADSKSTLIKKTTLRKSSSIEKPPEEGIDVIFVNGILTEMDAPVSALIELQRIIDEIKLSSNVTLYNFYNPSGRYEQNKTWRCLTRAVQQKSYKFWRECGSVEDFNQTSRQMANILSSPHNEAEPEAKTLAKIIRQERAAGKSVVLIGHSQGNLMIEQALQEFDYYDQCISAISLAGPLEKSSWLPWSSPNLDGFVVSGDKVSDAILLLGHNDFQKINTDISSIADDNSAKFNNSAGPYGAYNTMSLEVDLHSMVNSYLKGKESRALIKKMIKTQTDFLSENTDCYIQSGMHMYASSGYGIESGPSDLWIVPPYRNGRDTLVAGINLSSGMTTTITDLALSPDGELWGVSFSNLYKIDKETGLAEKMGFFTSMSPNGLAFSHTGELYVVGIGGKIEGIELEPLHVFWEGKFESSYISSGDIAFSPNGHLYAVVRDTLGKNMLANIDLKTGHAKPVSNKSISTEEVYGLAFIGPSLFGMTASEDGKGSLISIDLTTGQSTFIRRLEFRAFGSASNKRK